MLRNLKTIKRQCGSTYNVAPGFSKRLNAEEYLNLLYLNVATADESFRIFAKLYITITFACFGLNWTSFYNLHSSRGQEASIHLVLLLVPWSDYLQLHLLLLAGSEAFRLKIVSSLI
jgi:hypothetical protein